RRLMRDVLEHQGYEVIEAGECETGLEMLRARHPKLVLMDINLPGMSGLEAIKVIRADAAIAATPVMAVTASVMGNVREKIEGAGFNAFQPKPLNIAKFVEAVRQLAA
ncbi:MAG: response regulator, partial [Betaproteobacteria bacterium]|nr:response regulator [Betaproteobacteria bacterium]